MKTLLYSLGATEIDESGINKGHIITNTICHNKSDGSMKMYYYPDEHGGMFRCYTSCSCSFDIYELIRRVFETKGSELSFGECVQYVVGRTQKQVGFGFGFEIERIEKELATDEEMNWMEKVSKKKKVELPEIPVINKSIMQVFSKRYPQEFLNDGISVEAMDKFKIMYYEKASRIVIPHYNVSGDLIGLRGRYTGIFSDTTQKYMPLTIQQKTYSYPTFANLYGLHQNIEAIKKHRKVIIFESEKSVMQCYSIWGEDCFAVALSGSFISQHQIDVLLSLDIDRVLIATDKEYKETGTELELKAMKKMLDMGRKFSPYVSTYCLWDTEGLIDYKDSPSDHGKSVLMKLMKNKQEILNIETDVKYKALI